MEVLKRQVFGKKEDYRSLHASADDCGKTFLFSFMGGETRLRDKCLIEGLVTLVGYPSSTSYW